MIMMTITMLTTRIAMITITMLMTRIIMKAITMIMTRITMITKTQGRPADLVRPFGSYNAPNKGETLVDITGLRMMMMVVMMMIRRRRMTVNQVYFDLNVPNPR